MAYLAIYQQKVIFIGCPANFAYLIAASTILTAIVSNSGSQLFSGLYCLFHTASRENFLIIRSNVSLLCDILRNGSSSPTGGVHNQRYASEKETNTYVIFNMGKWYKQVNIRKSIQMANEHMKMIGHYFLENYKIKPQCDVTSLLRLTNWRDW